MTRLGVCSWSLQPTDSADLVRKIHAVGVTAVQLALDPLRCGQWDPRATAEQLQQADITIASGMVEMAGEDYSTLASIHRTGGVVPDEHWPANLAATRQAAALARKLGLGLVSFHAGFLPEDAGDPARAAWLQRVGTLADVFAECGVQTALETGQESAPALAAALIELDRLTLGVNFDPANMILYGSGDPLAAVTTLAPFVRQVHVKDALPAETPGAWGSEVPAGQGAVPWADFLALVEQHAPQADFMIEREAGDDRVRDIQTARRLVHQHCGGRLS